MPVFRVPKTANYTVMSNHHLRVVLLNAPMTMEHYCEAEVDRLLAGG